MGTLEFLFLPAVLGLLWRPLSFMSPNDAARHATMVRELLDYAVHDYRRDRRGPVAKFSAHDEPSPLPEHLRKQGEARAWQLRGAHDNQWWSLNGSETLPSTFTRASVSSGAPSLVPSA